MSRPQLVAHRGYMQAFPENTLAALRGALEAGGHYVEFDVQLSRDGVPMVFHDADLARTAGINGSIFERDAAELAGISAAQADRFGDRFRDEKIPTLKQVMDLLAAWPEAKAFVEIKRSSLRHFGHDYVMERVLAEILPCLSQCIVISYDERIIRMARERGVPEIGWVIESWDEAAQAQAVALAPEYIFGDIDEIPPGLGRLWPGPWRWVIYDVVDPQLALRLHERGAQMIETMAIGEMLRHARLRGEGA